jgi:hypothetical protein
MATITDTGKVAAAKLLNGVDAVPAFTYMATGSGSTAENASQTALVTENTLSGSARAAATCSYAATNKARWVKSFSFSGNVTVREIGIFNASSSGTMLLRHVLASDKAYVNGESVEITVDVTVS